jgi:hypothetical protein
MKYIRIMILIVLAAVAVPLHAQVNIEKELDQYKTTIKQTILREAEKEPKVKELLTGAIQVIVVPDCNFTGTAQQLLSDSTAIKELKIDTVNYKALIVKDQQPLVVVEKSGTRGITFMTRDEYGAETNMPVWVSMVKTAGYNSSVFALDLLTEESQLMKQVAIIKNSHLKFVDDSLNVYDGIKPLLVNRYGSIEKYVDLKTINLEKKRLLAKAGSPDIWKRLVRNDYSKWAQRYPSDTAGILNLFIKEMETIVKLTARQKEMLQEAIMDKLSSCSKYNGQPGIRFIDRDISPLVYSVLTQEQYAGYLRQRTLNAWLAGEVGTKLEYYYLREKHVPLDSLAKVYDQEVFTQK